MAGSGVATMRDANTEGTHIVRSSQRYFAFAGLIGAVLLLWFIAFLSYRSIVDFEGRARLVAHSHEVIAAAEHLYGYYAEARSSGFGFVVMGDPYRRNIFTVARTRLEQGLIGARQLVSDNPAQQNRLQQLEERMNGDLAILSRALDLRERGESQSSVVQIASQVPPIDGLRTALEEFMAEERKLLREREEGSQGASDVNRMVIAFGYSACLLILTVSMWYFQREATARLKAQNRIIALNREMQARAEALEESNSELENFSYSVSHDLRAPVRAIYGFAQILQDEYGERLDAEGLRLLGVVRNNAERMGQLIDDLLAFSRVGRQALTVVSVDMSALVGELLVALKESRAEPLRAQLTLEALPECRGDPTLLRQVWTNLIDNAIKYAGKVAQPQVHIRGEVDGNWAIYSVEDNGTGFDMQYASKLFETFQRLHHAADFPGTGVGLAIVKRIVTRHGGRVHAEGEPGRGARFSFALPLAGEEHGGL